MNTDPATQPRIGRVDLTVADLGRSMRFYEQMIGLHPLAQSTNAVTLGVVDRPLLQLVELPGARPVPQAAGLYHFALLLPSRHDLALSLAHLRHAGAPISGYADHAVSEAIYLTDPDGHGIEIYRDRPRHEWTYPNGQLKMATDPIDMHGILSELPSTPEAFSGLPTGTIMGHIHLQVSQIESTEDFYTGLLGFDRVLRYGPSATFMSTGGYHHHIGANTWAGLGAPTAPLTAARLQSYEIFLDDDATRDELAKRLLAAGRTAEREDHALVTADPSGIVVRLVVRQT